jgi:hypothetical protein
MCNVNRNTCNVNSNVFVVIIQVTKADKTSLLDSYFHNNILRYYKAKCQFPKKKMVVS